MVFLANMSWGHWHRVPRDQQQLASDSWAAIPDQAPDPDFRDLAPAPVWSIMRHLRAGGALGGTRYQSPNWFLHEIRTPVSGKHSSGVCTPVPSSNASSSGLQTGLGPDVKKTTQTIWILPHQKKQNYIKNSPLCGSSVFLINEFRWYVNENYEIHVFISEIHVFILFESIL